MALFILFLTGLSTVQAAETSFHAAGYGNVGLNVPVDGEGAWFPAAAFNPIFLWREGDRILIENEIAISDGEEGLNLELEYATVDVDLWGPVLVVGKFLTPAGQFISRLHPSWINKFPDFPLVYRAGVLPMSHLGASLQYAFHVGPQQKISAVAFVDQGPGAAIGGDPELTPKPSNPDGTFGYGGRLGLFPMPSLELGGSVYSSAYGDQGASRYSLLVADGAWTLSDQGIDLRGEFTQVTWDSGQFQGGWGQAAWRMVQLDPVRWLEPTVRFGYAEGDTFSAEVMTMSAGHDSAGVDLGDGPAYELCFGANTYLRNNVVAKVAYVHRVEVFEPTIRAQLAFGY